MYRAQGYCITRLGDGNLRVRRRQYVDVFPSSQRTDRQSNDRVVL